MEVPVMMMLMSTAVLGLISCVMGCSLPLNWERKTLPQLVAEADLVVLGEFLDVTNSTSAERPEQTDVRVNTAVYCVLRNPGAVDVPATIVIEDYVHPYDGRCTDNLFNVKTPGNMVIFIRKKENNNYEFRGYNVQSASWSVNDAELSEVMRTCSVLEATSPTGASSNICPQSAVTTDTCADSSSHHTAASYTLLSSLVIAAFWL